MPLWEQTFNESSPVGWPIPPFCQNVFEILVLPEDHTETSLGPFPSSLSYVIAKAFSRKNTVSSPVASLKNTFSTNTYSRY